MIIFMAPSRICGARSLGMPLCWRAYGKMAYSSRNKSASVSAEPFTRATTFAEGFAGAWAGAGLNTVGAWDATWACDEAMARKRNPHVVYLRCTVDLLVREKKGRVNVPPSPFHAKGNLEHGSSRAAVHFVCFSTMALAAELRRLVASGGGAGRVIRAAQEEHGRIRPLGQTAGRGRRDIDHVHQVLVMAGGAQNHRRVVVVARSDEEPIVRHELGRVLPGHQNLGAADCAIPVIGSAAAHHCIDTYRVIVQIVSRSSVAVVSEQGRDVIGLSISGGQGLIDLVLHHRARRIVSVVAAEAHQHAGNVRPGSEIGQVRQSFYVTTVFALAGGDGYTLQAG